jgi:hypothetical protein
VIKVVQYGFRRFSSSPADAADACTGRELMEPRLLLAYAMIVVLAACFFGAWLWYSRDWRSDRRAHKRSDVSRQKRRDERLRDEGAA